MTDIQDERRLKTAVGDVTKQDVAVVLIQGPSHSCEPLRRGDPGIELKYYQQSGNASSVYRYQRLRHPYRGCLGFNRRLVLYVRLTRVQPSRAMPTTKKRQDMSGQPKGCRYSSQNSSPPAVQTLSISLEPPITIRFGRTKSQWLSQNLHCLVGSAFLLAQVSSM